MYASRFQKRKANRAKRPVKRVPRKRSGGRQAIVKIVKSVISRNAENKAWFDYGANQSISCTVSATPTNKNLMPVVSQGTGHSQRVGNEIRVKSGYIRGHVNLLPYDATLNNLPVPAYCKIWILSCREKNGSSLASTSIGNDFFDIVNSSIGMQGTMLDIDLTVNKDAWIIHGTKTLKLGVGAITSTGPIGTNGYYEGSSSFSTPFSFNIGKYMKTLKYDDTDATVVNKNMFIAFQVVPANGASGANQIMAEFHYCTRVEYEDM